jgi:hypothetical protein
MTKVSAVDISKLIEFAPFVIDIVPPVDIIFAAVNLPAIEPINIRPLFK